MRPSRASGPLPSRRSDGWFSFARQKRTRKAPLFRGAGTNQGLLALDKPKVEQNPPKSGGVPFGTNAFPISGDFQFAALPQKLLLRCSESNGGSTCSSVNAQQGDGGDLVAQGLEALGGAVIGGELQNVLSGGVCVLRQGQNDALAVCQTLTGQILALVLRNRQRTGTARRRWCRWCCTRCTQRAPQQPQSLQPRKKRQQRKPQKRQQRKR